MSRYIDADKLKEILFITANFADLKKVFEGYIDKTPTEDVKPIVKGEWLAFTCKLSSGEGGVYYKCSNCRVTSSKFYEFFERNPEIQMDLPNYCPVCGAKMERGKCQNE